MATKTLGVNEIYEQIKADLKVFQKEKKIKLSVTRKDYDCFCVAIISSKEKLATEPYFSLNHYYLQNETRLTDIGLEYAKEINDIVHKNFWSETDSQVDYFNQAFYFRFSVGKYEKPYQVI